MFSVDQYKALFTWRGDNPDAAPNYGLVYLVLLPVVAATGSVAWLGWTWPALAVASTVTILVGGLFVRRFAKSWQSERSQIPEWRR